MNERKHKVLVFSSLFPSSVAPGSGLFVRERMFRVAKHADIVVVSPKPWFPGQALIRLFKKNYRPMPERTEQQQGVVIYFPRFLSLPGVFRNLDGIMMAICSYHLVKRLKLECKLDIIDSHFTYPDGWAATWLGRRLRLPVTITLRGTEVPHSSKSRRRRQLLQAWEYADRLFTVSDSLQNHAISLGADPGKFCTIGNGIDTEKFKPIDKHSAKQQLGLETASPVMITVGGLVERKGFHRVIACLPELIKSHPQLIYLIVGGPSAEGNYEPQIRELAESLGVSDHLRFLGSLPPGELSQPLSAADIFILSSSNEGWANVILEAMACGTPVIASDVGGNAEVVASRDLGEIVPFGGHDSLLHAISSALEKTWNPEALVQYAQDNHWDRRVAMILQEYDLLCPPDPTSAA